MLKRTHRLHEIEASLVGKTITVNGWVDRVRNLGGIIFVWVRDRYGLVQVVFDPESSVYESAKTLSGEYVVGIRGIVRERPEEARNKDLATGNFEILAGEMEILSDAKTPPIYTNREEGSEEVRLRYRYLDLRRQTLQNNIIFRHKLIQKAREYFNSLDFVDIETPYLTKSTPEGARDFLVPSRLKRGNFYALPQSPQIFKQLLMISGFDRYYQIVRCFRDEDLRADRQPEFTQIDLEMSFVEQSDVQEVVGGFVKKAYLDLLGLNIGEIPTIEYQLAMERYGSDKPDLRFGMEIEDLTGEAWSSNAGFLSPGDWGALKMIIVNGGSSMTRKELDAYVESAGSSGLKAGWAKASNGDLSGGVSKILKAANAGFNVKDGDLILLCNGKRADVNAFLGKTRLDMARKFGMIPEKDVKAAWIVNFPMFEWNEEDGRYQAQHHPFTMPYLEDIEAHGEEPSKIRSHSYDLVINGWELGSGSVRIHSRQLQEKIFKLIDLSEGEAKKRFGFFLEAFEYGAPPHAGFAIGLDRLVSIMIGTASLRDVIAFPKTTSGTDLMADAPSEVAETQLKELGMKMEVDE